MYNRKLNENYLLTRARLHENLKQKSSILLPPDLNSHFQELKRVQLQCYALLNALKAT